MSGPTRNFCVARGTLIAETYKVVYQVPADHSFILKSIIVSSDGATGTKVLALFQPAVNGPLVYFINEQYPTNFILVFSGWMVANATDMLVLLSGGSSATYWVSGALLSYGGATPPVTSQLAAPPPPKPPPDHGPPPQYVRIIH